MVELNIWNGYSKIRALDSAEDVAAIELLSDDARTALFECIAAETAKEAGELRTFAARSRVRELALMRPKPKPIRHRRKRIMCASTQPAARDMSCQRQHKSARQCSSQRDRTH